ncbi:hypothetical protein [Edaphobacter modestus]|uniref:Uncharacterized protein n=1 Tax=Edaphobacter modestus TaxID=388466 RepID=A0A4Q7YXI5_9BACT|nr:hypothetical protein [Edaphobacter modestus]RZU41921.1 hypothetical protein BDD14_3463 [Edaphobacter modestus]
MMREVIDEARQTMDEMPAFVAAFLLLVAMCVGVRCAVFYEADGEQLRLTTEGVDAEAMSENDAISRMRAHAECSAKVPGFTVIVGVRQYNMELSVPVPSVRALFENARISMLSAFPVEVNGRV